MPRPLILITPHTESQGTELPDPAVSLSSRYADAILAAGGQPVILPCCQEQPIVRDAIARADGVLLSGGDDIAPELYGLEPSADLRSTIVPAEGGRDLFELIVIDEVFRQARPLLAICRGQQMVNVALGGGLIADIARQCPTALQHNRQKERLQPVHDVNIEPGSVLARVVGDVRIRVNSTHHQAVDKIAPPLRVTARSPDGIVEALELAPDHANALPFFLAVQFHPERLFDRYPEHGRIFAAFMDPCGKAPPSRATTRCGP